MIPCRLPSVLNVQDFASESTVATSTSAFDQEQELSLNTHWKDEWRTRLYKSILCDLQTLFGVIISHAPTIPSHMDSPWMAYLNDMVKNLQDLSEQLCVTEDEEEKGLCKRNSILQKSEEFEFIDSLRIRSLPHTPTLDTLIDIGLSVVRRFSGPDEQQQNIHTLRNRFREEFVGDIESTKSIPLRKISALPGETRKALSKFALAELKSSSFVLPPNRSISSLEDIYSTDSNQTLLCGLIFGKVQNHQKAWASTITPMELIVLYMSLGCVGLSVRWPGRSVNVALWVPYIMQQCQKETSGVDRSKTILMGEQTTLSTTCTSLETLADAELKKVRPEINQTENKYLQAAPPTALRDVVSDVCDKSLPLPLQGVSSRLRKQNKGKKTQLQLQPNQPQQHPAIKRYMGLSSKFAMKRPLREATGQFANYCGHEQPFSVHKVVPSTSTQRLSNKHSPTYPQSANQFRYRSKNSKVSFLVPPVTFKPLPIPKDARFNVANKQRTNRSSPNPKSKMELHPVKPRLTSVEHVFFEKRPIRGEQTIAYPISTHTIQIAKEYVTALTKLPEIEQAKETISSALKELKSSGNVAAPPSFILNVLLNLSQRIKAGATILRFIITLVQCGCWSGIYVTQFLTKVIEFLDK